MPVVIDTGGTIEMFCCCWAVSPVASVNVTKNTLGPFDAGVPEMTPVAEFSCNPGGSVPEEIDQVYGVAPPEPASVCEYGTPTTPPGNGVDVIVRLRVILIVNAFWTVCAGGGEESVT